VEYPTKEEAVDILEWAGKKNPGKWVEHSKNVALAAKIICEKLGDADPEKAYVLGLLHDIGRYVGLSGVRHILEGYRLCMRNGWEKAARICMTHSYMIQDIKSEIAQWDVTEEEKVFIRDYISECKYDFYDRLIQLCDSLATDRGFCLLETRFIDVARRYGVGEYTVPRWEAVIAIKEEIESKIGCSIYDLLPVYLS